MAENVNALILPIGADPSQFEKSINEVKYALRSLQKDISSKPFNLVTEQDKQNLQDYKSTLENLQSSVQKTGAAFNNTVGPTKNARTALTSLSLVAQDAPFGFIAIQNNLPGVIQSFGELTRTSGGVKGALSAITSSLSGPAGLFLAFSAVTAAVTVAVQKYGSLGAAADALFGKVDALADVKKRATESLKNFNKEYKTVGETIANANASVESQIIKLEALSDTVLNVNASENARKKALQDLQSLDNERFKNFDIEKGKLEGLKNAVNEYTDAVLARAVAENLADRTAEALSAREVQRNLYGESLKQLNEFKKRVPDIEKQVANFNKELLISSKLQKGKIGSALPTASEDVSDYLELTLAVEKYEKELIALNNTYVNAKKVAKDATMEALSFGGSLKKAAEEKKDKIPGLGKIIEGTQGEGVITTNLALFEKYIQGQVRINNAGVDKMVRYRREQLNALDLMPKKLEKEVGTLGLSLPFGPEAQKNLQQYYLGLFEIEGIYQRFKDAQMSGANEFARLQEQLKQFNSLKDSIESNLTRPFRDFFDELLDNGKVSFDNFVQLAKDAFKRILAQALASGIANLIAAALSGGGSLAFTKLGAAKKISATLSGLGKVGGLFGSANFSGVQGSSMQMAGAVNLTLRGSDLVASINRTNTTINRVG